MVRITETESRMVVTRGRGGGKEAELFNGYRVSVLQDEKAVETAEQRGECILLRRTAHMKMVKVEVLLVQFYHKK